MSLFDAWIIFLCIAVPIVAYAYWVDSSGWCA